MRDTGIATCATRCCFRRTMGSAIEAGHRVFLEIGAHPVLRHDIASCLSEQSVPSRRWARCAGRIASAPRCWARSADCTRAGREIDWSQAVSGRRRRRSSCRPIRSSRSSIGANPRRTAGFAWAAGIILCWECASTLSKPSWKGDLVSTELDWIADHVIGGSIVFPGAGYVEMALAAAREVHGSGPCILEEIEFQKFLVIDPSLSLTVQTELDTASGELGVHVRSDPASSAWDLHARIRVKAVAPPSRPALDLAEIRRRCPDVYRPRGMSAAVRGRRLPLRPDLPGHRAAVVRRWRGSRRDPRAGRACCRIFPTIGCIPPCSMPASSRSSRSSRSGTPAGARTTSSCRCKIDRVCFHAPLPARMFAYMRVVHLVPTEIKVDLQIVDEGGVCLAEIFGLTARQAAQRPQAFGNALYEYQWKLASREAARSGRSSHHLPSPAELDPVLAGGRREPAPAAPPPAVPGTSTRRGRARRRRPTSCARCAISDGRRTWRRCRSRRSPIVSASRRSIVAGSP